MCSLHAVTLLCLSLTHYDILIEDLVLRKTPAEAGVTFLKSDIIRRRFTYFSCFFFHTRTAVPRMCTLTFNVCLRLQKKKIKKDDLKNYLGKKG